MLSFQIEHMNLIDESCSQMIEIERAIFNNGYNLPRKQKSLLSSYSIVMLYAVWEGFVSNSFKIYVNYINKQAVPYHLLKESILIYTMEARFKQFKDYPGNDLRKFSFFISLYQHCQQNVPEIYEFVDTESNVGFEVLNKLMDMFGLHMFPTHWDIYRYPQPNLRDMMSNFLRHRNAYAHDVPMTDEVVITIDVYEKYRTMLRSLMYAMHEEFLRGISEQTYIIKNNNI